MKITNTTKHIRTLSHRGIEFRLMPGAGVDVPMTAAEAAALSAIFTVSGEPEDTKPAKAKPSTSKD